MLERESGMDIVSVLSAERYEEQEMVRKPDFRVVSSPRIRRISRASGERTLGEGKVV